MLLGLTIGVAEATSDPNLVIISGIIGGIADMFGNSIGFLFFNPPKGERKSMMRTPFFHVKFKTC